MSTYLVALVVSDFVCEGDNNVNMPLGANISVQVCARPTAKDELSYPLSAAIDIIKFFEQYYQTQYPFPKCDHAAVKDFRFGAMENWGLAIYQERNLLYNAQTTTKAAEQNIVRIISHEIAHQWVGKPYFSEFCFSSLFFFVYLKFTELHPKKKLVRKFGHAKMVERSVAQRGLRALHGKRGHQQHSAVLEDV